MIITLTDEQAKLVRSALCSAAAQEYKNGEHKVADDLCDLASVFSPGGKGMWVVIFNGCHYGTFGSELEAETFAKDNKMSPYGVVQLYKP